MNDDELAIFIHLRSANAEQINQMCEELLKKSWVLNAIGEHCEVRGLEVSKSVQIMVLSISDGIIGYAVKYLDVILKWSNLQSQKSISFDDFAMKIFPFGFPDFSKQRDAG